MEAKHVALKAGRVEQMEATTRLMLSMDQAVVALGLSRSEIYNLMQRGDLPYVQIGRRRLVSMDDLRAFVHRHRVRAQGLEHRRQRFAETLPPRTTLSKGSLGQRKRRSDKDVPLAERYAKAERAEVQRQRQSVPATGPAAD